MKIEIMPRTIYGVEAYYPICPNAVAFAKIAGTKTLTRETLFLIKSLGYTIEVIRHRSAIDDLVSA